MFDQYSDKSLERTQYGPVQHHRHLTRTVLRYVLGIKTAGHGKINLNGTQLPDSTNAILERKFDLGTVKSALPW